jgi:hypothetical protein
MTSRPLGDPHNFGRRVAQRGRWIVKPRPVLWEWALLSRESPLRKLLGEPFGFLPTLDIVVARGEVERVKLAPLRPSKHANAELAAIFGRALALFSWLGVSDLHWENLVLGVDRGRIVFGPLDVEMILSELSLPTQTKLLPEADRDYAHEYRHAAGVRRVLGYLGKPISAEHLLAIVHAYRESIDFLDANASAVAAIFKRLPALRKTPIRVLLRATGDYARAKSEPIWPPLLDAEAEQLARGDVPYFFRLYGERGIRFYRDAKLETEGRLPARGDVPRLEQLLSIERGLRSRSRRVLREQGLLAIIGAFDDRSLDGRHRSGEVELTLRARTIALEIGGERLECPRKLGAIVGSAYLPCRCGEARSVFV